MNAAKREPEVAARSADRQSPQRIQGEARAEMRAASRDEGYEDPQAGDEVDEPGYGHGV